MISSGITYNPGVYDKYECVPALPQGLLTVILPHDIYYEWEYPHGDNIEAEREQ